MIARQRDDATAAVSAAEAPAELTYKEPRRARVYRTMPVETLDHCANDVAIDRFGVGEHECGDWPHCSLDRVEDLDRCIREAKVGLNGDGLGAERLQLIAQPRDISGIAAPRHALVVASPECGRNVPALSSESQRDRGADAFPPAGAGNQRDAGRSVFTAHNTDPSAQRCQQFLVQSALLAPRSGAGAQVLCEPVEDESEALQPLTWPTDAAEAMARVGHPNEHDLAAEAL